MEFNSNNKILILRLFKKNKNKIIISFKLKSNIRKRLIKKNKPFKRISKFLIRISEFFIKLIKSFIKFIKLFIFFLIKFHKSKKSFINLYENRTLKKILSILRNISIFIKLLN